MNKTLEQDKKIQKCHEIVDKAISEAILRPFGGQHTPRSCMLTSVAKVQHRTHRKVGSKQGDGRMDGKRES